MRRREFLSASAVALGAPTTIAAMPKDMASDPGTRPTRADGVQVLNPRARVPVSLIIDDSTCLVNLAHFAIPQFAEVFPDRYPQAWQDLPREIPDRFVERFADWCADHGVRGKYSIVPYPACVGWIDREMPGWSRRELDASLALVRERITPAFDIHPEMISHTWAIDTKTGRPFRERTEAFMENWGFSQHKSADELTEYLAYALRILKDAGLACEGITTPGGFCNQNRDNLARATLDAVSGVFAAEIPHYFRDLFTDDRSVAPRVQLASDFHGPAPHCVVSIIGCTGDWFGGWNGLERGLPDQFISADGRAGRLVEVIGRAEPAILVGHWPGFYCNGSEYGFDVFQTVVKRLETHFKHLIWMKTSEIARYWAARTLAIIDVSPNPGQILSVTLRSPFHCPDFTIRINKQFEAPPRLLHDGQRQRLTEVRSIDSLEDQSWFREPDDSGVTVCFNLQKGETRLDLAAV